MDAVDAKGHKPVHEAAVAGHRAVVERLLPLTAPDAGVSEGNWTVAAIMEAAKEARAQAEEEQERVRLWAREVLGLWGSGGGASRPSQIPLQQPSFCTLPTQPT